MRARDAKQPGFRKLDPGWRSEIGKGMKEGDGGGGGGFPPVLIPIYAASEPRPVTTPEAV